MQWAFNGSNCTRLVHGGGGQGVAPSNHLNSFAVPNTSSGGTHALSPDPLRFGSGASVSLKGGGRWHDCLPGTPALCGISLLA